MCQPDRTSAFSLLELLVVISIMALLIGILAPALKMFRQQAIKTACSSNLRQIGIATEVYRMNFGERFPMARYMPAPFITIFPHDPGLPLVLNQQMPSVSKVYRCPGDDGYVYGRAGISYTYNASLAGRRLDETWFVRRLHFAASQVPVAYDCDGDSFELVAGTTLLVPPFHMLRNLLFGDGHVGNYQ